MSQPLFPVVEVPDFYLGGQPVRHSVQKEYEVEHGTGRLRERWGAPD